MSPPQLLDPRERVFARCASLASSDGRIVSLNVEELFTRLLLFESQVVDSIRLQEFPELVRVAGIGPTLEILDSGGLEVAVFAISIAQTGQTSILEKRMAKGVLPLFGYSFDVVRTADLKGDLLKHLDQVEVTTRQFLHRKDARRLKHAIWNHTVQPQEWDALGSDSLRQLETDLLARTDLVQLGVERSLEMELGQPGPAFKLELERIDDKDFKAITDLGRVAGIPDEVAHKVIGRGLLALGGLNLRFEEMKSFDAVTVFTDEDLPLLDARLDYLTELLNPGAQEARFHRVARIADVPDMSDPEAVDVKRLLEIRNSEACVEFRRWLRGIDRATDEEIEEMFRPVRDRLSKAARHPAGRVARFATTGAVGLIPVVGILAGVALGALDTFALERLLPEPGPTAFLSQDYPSVFD